MNGCIAKELDFQYASVLLISMVSDTICGIADCYNSVLHLAPDWSPIFTRDIPCWERGHASRNRRLPGGMERMCCTAGESDQSGSMFFRSFWYLGVEQNAVFITVAILYFPCVKMILVSSLSL